MATLLVIGGSGFFGKSILDMFQRGNLSRWNIEKMIVMSRNVERLKVETPWLVEGNVELLADDISTAKNLPSADYIIHAAASTDARNYLSSGTKERENIQAGTLNYCALAKKFHVKAKILYVSSGAVYGTQPANLANVPESYEVTDPRDIPEGKRDYAIAKRDAEKAIVQLGAEGLSVSIARCFAFVGPYLPRDQHFAIGNFIADGLAKRSITVKATYPVYRSYMYADDLVEWMMTIAENANPNCSIFNVGSDEPVMMGELAEKVAAHFGVKVEAQEVSNSKIDRYVPCVSKAFADLGLKCKFSLDQAVAESKLKIKSLENQYD